MADPIDPKMLDKRIVLRFIKKGVFSEKEFEKHLKTLPDLTDKCAAVEATIEPMHVGASGSHPEEE